VTELSIRLQFAVPEAAENEPPSRDTWTDWTTDPTSPAVPPVETLEDSKRVPAGDGLLMATVGLVKSERTFTVSAGEVMLPTSSVT
jgi:hypothetical protein